MFATRGNVADSPLLLLDDIYTTGSTVSSAAMLLRSMTDKPIYLAVIARQPMGEMDT
jgi:predicted amidophosphoribosyltransferase